MLYVWHFWNDDTNQLTFGQCFEFYSCFCNWKLSKTRWNFLYLNVSLRYLGPWDPGTLGPWDPWTLEPLDLGTLGPLTSANPSSYFPWDPLTSFCLFLLLSSFGMVWLWGGWVVTFEDEIGDGHLTFTLILKSCGVGGWNPETSSSTFSSSDLLPPPYSSQLLQPPPKPPPNSSYLLKRVSDD